MLRGGVFIRRGLAGAGTKEIAEVAGVAEATLYRHFDSKADLFDAAVLGPLESFTTNVGRRARELATATRQDRYEICYELQLELGRAMQQMAPLLNSALYHNNESAQSFYRERLGPLLTRLQNSIEVAMQGWSTRKATPSS